IWSLSQLDFAQYHAYGMPQPTTGLSGVVQSFLTHYHKPALIGEFGVDWRGWNRSTVDPYLRGFRQGLWSGALNGSTGIAISWWWEDIDGENLYSYYQAITAFTGLTSWGAGNWQPVAFFTTGDPPTDLGGLVPGGQPFTLTLTPNPNWAVMVSGTLA